MYALEIPMELLSSNGDKTPLVSMAECWPQSAQAHMRDFPTPPHAVIATIWTIIRVLHVDVINSAKLPNTSHSLSLSVSLSLSLFLFLFTSFFTRSCFLCRFRALAVATT